MKIGLLGKSRNKFHMTLLNRHILSVSDANSIQIKKYGTSVIASNADSGQKTSTLIANSIITILANNNGYQLQPIKNKQKGQTLGNLFEKHRP